MMAYKNCSDETVEAAFAEFEEAATNPVAEYCPLVQGKCKSNCVCFVPPRKVKTHISWTIYSHYCNNEMFFKEEYNVNCRQC